MSGRDELGEALQQRPNHIFVGCVLCDARCVGCELKKNIDCELKKNIDFTALNSLYLDGRMR